MPKYEIRITSTVTNHYLVEAQNSEEAEDIATFGEANSDDMKPHYTKHGEEIIDVEAVDESP